MAAKATISGVLSTPDTTQKQLFIDFTVALTGNYGTNTSHGDTLDLTALGDSLKSTQLPTWVEFEEYPAAGTAPTGYIFGYAPGTTQANGLLTIINNLTEYTEGSAYSAPLLAAVIRGRAWFPSEI